MGYIGRLVVTIMLFIVAISLSMIWFGWKLTLVIILFMWANNLENKNDEDFKDRQDGK